MLHFIVSRIPRSLDWGVYEISTGYNRLVQAGFSTRTEAEDAIPGWYRIFERTGCLLSR